MILSTIVALFCVGCRQKERKDVIGTYIANHGKGLDEIELKQDGTYIYRCELNDGSKVTNTSHWSFYDDHGEPRITFDHFQFCLTPYSKTPPGYWDVRVQRSMTGRLELALDSDVNFYYIKQ